MSAILWYLFQFAPEQQALCKSCLRFMAASGPRPTAEASGILMHDMYLAMVNLPNDNGLHNAIVKTISKLVQLRLDDTIDAADWMDGEEASSGDEQTDDLDSSFRFVQGFEY